MYKILIVSALSQELKIIKQQFQSLGSSRVKFSYFSTGMGNYNMILNLTTFLVQQEFDFILNIGVCGYKNEKVDVLEVARIYNLANAKEVLVPVLLNICPLKSIACSEKIIQKESRLAQEEFVDMESYGFELVCDSFSFPRSIFKVPVDKIGEETKNFDIALAEKNLLQNIDYATISKKIIQYLDRNKQEVPNFDTYFTNWNFTFSEKEIFKKFYFQYTSLVSEEFYIFFEQHKHVSKKQFLQNLETFLAPYLIR